MKKRLIMPMILLFFITLPLVNGYSAPVGKEATWEVKEDNIDAFLYINEGSIIKITVINNSDTGVNVLLSSTDFVEEEPIIDYTSERCFPFIVPTSLLNQTTSLFYEERQETLYGVERTIITLLVQNTYLDDGKQVDYTLDYDLDTGLLIKWTITQDFETEIFETIIELTDTNFWEVEDINGFVVFFNANKGWILPIGVIFFGIFGSYYIFRVTKTDKTAVVKLNRKKKTKKPKVKKPKNRK